MHRYPRDTIRSEKRKGKRINDIIAELKRKSDVTVSELSKLTSESNAKEKKKKIEQNFPKEWQGVSIMRWGGQVIIDCNRSVQHMENTCTMDNLLWICMCWYRSKPCTMAFLEKSSNNAARSFIDVLDLLLTGSYEDAKYRFGRLNSNKTPTIDSANFWGSDTDLSSAPLMSILERKGRFRCNSHYCPGDAPRTLCNAILSVTSTEDKNLNLLETAIKMWESGEAEERCRGLFKEKPTNHDEDMQYGYEITDIGSKKEIYKCTGKVIAEGLKFVNNPPFIQFEIENKLCEKIKDLNLIPK